MQREKREIKKTSNIIDYEAAQQKRAITNEKKELIKQLDRQLIEKE